MRRTAAISATLAMLVGCGARSGLFEGGHAGLVPGEEGPNRRDDGSGEGWTDPAGPDEPDGAMNGSAEDGGAAGGIDDMTVDGGAPAGADDATAGSAGTGGERAVSAQCREDVTSCQGPSWFDDECVVGGCSAECYEGCSHGCIGGGCDYFCQSSRPCELNCDGGDCEFECRGGGDCQLDCAGGGCDLQCTGHTEIACDMDCCGGDCALTCGAGRACRIDCAAGGCDISCERDSTCEVSCCGGGCDVECDGCAVFVNGSPVTVRCADGASPLQCSDGTIACGRC